MNAGIAILDNSMIQNFFSILIILNFKPC